MFFIYLNSQTNNCKAWKFLFTFYITWDAKRNGTKIFLQAEHYISKLHVAHKPWFDHSCSKYMLSIINSNSFLLPRKFGTQSRNLILVHCGPGDQCGSKHFVSLYLWSFKSSNGAPLIPCSETVINTKCSGTCVVTGGRQFKFRMLVMIFKAFWWLWLEYLRIFLPYKMAQPWSQFCVCVCVSPEYASINSVLVSSNKGKGVLCCSATFMELSIEWRTELSLLAFL